MRVNILEAKNRLSQLIKSAQAGEEIIIANRSEPVARLVLLTKTPDLPTHVGSPAAILAWLEQHPLPAYARRSEREIDAAIADERAASD